MHNTFRDISRLELILDFNLGLESFSITTRFKDFVRYYFTRFLKNVSHAFKDFTTPEIDNFNRRYQSQIQVLIKDPKFNMEGVIIPIPKGMIKNYKDTVTSLSNVLGRIQADRVQHDLTGVLDLIKHRDVTANQNQSFTKTDFEECKGVIGSLYGKTGLTHMVANHAFSSPDDIERTNEILLRIVNKYYKLIFELNILISEIEKTHGEVKFEQGEKEQVAAALMSIAQRLSIFAVVMEHIQDMEHSFTKSLEILLKYR